MTPEEYSCCVLAFVVVASFALCAWFCSCRGSNRAIEGFVYHRDASDILSLLDGECKKLNYVACNMLLPERKTLLDQLMFPPPQGQQALQAPQVPQVPQGAPKAPPKRLKLFQKSALNTLYSMNCATGKTDFCEKFIKARGGNEANIAIYNNCRRSSPSPMSCNITAVNGNFSGEPPK